MPRRGLSEGCNAVPIASVGCSVARSLGNKMHGRRGEMDLHAVAHLELERLRRLARNDCRQTKTAIEFEAYRRAVW